MVDYQQGAPLHALPPQQVYAALGTRSAGLTAAEAAARLSRAGPNVLSELRGKPLYLRLLANFTHLMALLLWAGGIMAFVAQMPALGVAIWMVNVINGAFSFVQEYKAERATAAMRRLLPTNARVIRDGVEARLDARELAPGDLILLAEGDRIPADARLVLASELRVDESNLTGESRPVRKTADAAPAETSRRSESPNLIFAGTTVAGGTGRAVVFATGMQSAFGEIARLTQTVGDELSPLQREMETVTRVVTLFAVGVGLIFFLISVVAAGITLAESFIFTIGMIVAFVPEGLLPTVTLALAMGTQRMAARHALVKRLSAVETLGCTTVICTDKTGTLTQNEMTVRHLWLPGQALTVTGTGYTPEGDLQQDGRALPGPAGGDVRGLLSAAALCCNARLLPPDRDSSRWTVLGDPTEASLLVTAVKAGIDLAAEAGRMPRVAEVPFDSRRKRMSTVHDADGQRVACVKGSPGDVMALCVSVRLDGRDRPMDDVWRARIAAANDEYARNGLRVLAIAARVLSGARESPGWYTEATVERELTFLGLAAMMDPPRPEVSAAVSSCHRAGIRIIMITGDYGLTAESIARRIGILHSAQPRVINGVELDALDDSALAVALQGEVIFARVSPEHKLRVVGALQRLGHVVAVTGDGVNDAPALKKADIGVAMGASGTDVAREAADMILADDNFASIVNAVEEGRAVYANIKKFATYVFTSNAPEAVPFFLFVLTRGRIPLALNVMHVLSIDLGTDMVPALALGAEPPEPGAMDAPPRKLSAHVVTRGLLLRAYAWLGVGQSVAAMAAFYYMYWTSGHAGQWLDLPDSGPLYGAATAMALAAVVTTQIGNLFAQRTETAPLMSLGWRRLLVDNRMIWAGIASELLLVMLITYAPPFQTFVGTAAFPVQNWLFLLAWTPLLLVMDEARKFVARRLARRARREAV